MTPEMFIRPKDLRDAARYLCPRCAAELERNPAPLLYTVLAGGRVHVIYACFLGLEVELSIPVSLWVEVPDPNGEGTRMLRARPAALKAALNSLCGLDSLKLGLLALEQFSPVNRLWAASEVFLNELFGTLLLAAYPELDGKPLSKEVLEAVGADIRSLAVSAQPAPTRAEASALAENN